jgi:hypothetical protein
VLELDAAAMMSSAEKPLNAIVCSNIVAPPVPAG